MENGYAALVMGVLITAPHKAALENVLLKVRKRAVWIKRQQRYFSEFLPQTPPRRYVSGETHRYLGRQYRLKVIEAPTAKVKLRGRFIWVHTPRKTDTARVREFPGATCFFNMILVIFKTNQCYGRFGKQLTQFSELKVIDWLDFYLGFAVPRRQFWSTHRFAVLRFEACIFVKTNLQQVNSILCLKNIFLEQIACGCVASGLHFFW